MSQKPRFDLAINDGVLFDGTGAPRRKASLGIRDGRVAQVRAEAYSADEARESVDASGKWVVPGFIDCHTHYDAEIEGAPALSESIRHGVTTVMLGGCSLGAVYSSALDVADMFTRVEGLPRDAVLRLLEKSKTWDDARTYVAHFRELALGPNVAAFAGHSDVRARAMGLGRSVDHKVSPTDPEIRAMETMLHESLDAGFLGASLNANKWDKLDGTRFRSQPLPSTFASYDEYRHVTRVLRERGAILQGIPNISTKVNALFFLAESVGIGRKPLKTNVVSLVDVRSGREIAPLLRTLARGVNRMGADFRWQALPVMFDIFADGVDVPVFEEFGAGTAALHIADLAERKKLFSDPEYRRWFKRQWANFLLPRVFHRDFNCSTIEACPDASLVGKSFAEVAEARGEKTVDVFLDLCAKYNDELRWSTIIGNDRQDALEKNLTHPDILVGFADSGAHLRNMAFYNMQLRMLRMVKDAESQDRPFMSLERAVYRLTGELGEWFEIDAGKLEEGARADLVVVEPAALDERLDAISEAPIPEFGGFVRMVRRNDAAVPLVVVGGTIAWRDGEAAPALGNERLGAFLPYQGKGLVTDCDPHHAPREHEAIAREQHVHA